MNRYSYFKIAFFANIVLIIGLFAFTVNATISRADEMQDLRQDMQRRREDLKHTAREAVDEVKLDAQNQRRALYGTSSDKRNNVREAGKVIIDQMRDDLRQKRIALIAEYKMRRDEFRAKAKERVDALKKHFDHSRAERIERFFSNMVRKFEHAFDNLNKLSNRISSHLEKLTAKGIDISAFEATIEDANAKIETAEGALEDAKARFSEMTLSENPKEAFKIVKQIVLDVASQVKDAHRTLVGVIRLINGNSHNDNTEHGDNGSLENGDDNPKAAPTQ
jgi:F0F1-type ATP synthase membrane subunit b/b'